jgi:ABC-type glycerol-3-phosphate transport system substrate-binding protein
MQIEIHETFSDTEELVRALEYIKGLIEEGYTSGYHPGWELKTL